MNLVVVGGLLISEKKEMDVIALRQALVLDSGVPRKP